MLHSIEFLGKRTNTKMSQDQHVGSAAHRMSCLAPINECTYTCHEHVHVPFAHPLCHTTLFEVDVRSASTLVRQSPSTSLKVSLQRDAISLPPSPETGQPQTSAGGTQSVCPQVPRQGSCHTPCPRGRVTVGRCTRAANARSVHPH